MPRLALIIKILAMLYSNIIEMHKEFDHHSVTLCVAYERHERNERNGTYFRTDCNAYSYYRVYCGWRVADYFLCMDRAWHYRVGFVSFFRFFVEMVFDHIAHHRYL